MLGSSLTRPDTVSHTQVLLYYKQNEKTKRLIQQPFTNPIPEELKQPVFTPACASNVRPCVMISEAVEIEKQEEAECSPEAMWLDVVHVAGCFVVARFIATY